ncbi:dihydroorotase [Vicingus serpentipes]|uniref:Dihydroorotase n=1 Tax=Vicingus serpentipes TaxID=1926625 RepID=A0A5C6RYW0_9FLAO|nr:dihydroorotase [Vicingus serpentipes]TXB67155.1 dihydroorotase [Vicingus serpentipes]
MNILIKSATVVNANSPLNGKKIDILIEKGVIQKIASCIKNANNYKEISHKDLHVSAGWIDMRANFCDPGYEYKEDLISGLNAAAKGGFTEVITMPDTLPVVDSKSGIEYIINKTKDNIVTVYPTGALSHNCEGKEIAEMYDMHLAGAIAFTDNKHAISNPSLLNRALLYSQSFGGLIMDFPNDKNLFNNGQINEGVISTKLGLKGAPALAEELTVTRSLYLAEYCNAPIHLTNITTKKSVQLIKEAKAKGLKVTADVNSYHLLLNETELETFDSNLKVKPPLRTKDDNKALIKGLKEGTIDAVCSDHNPEDIENKQCEFDNTAFGMINLQTSFAVMNTALTDKVDLTEIIESITSKPRAILKLSQPQLKEGEIANLTLFSPSTEFVLEKNQIVSKSKNSPFIGRTLKGTVIGIVNKNKVKMA